MGQKVHPKAFRLPVSHDWSSRWIATNQRYKNLLQEDIKVRELIMSRLRAAGVSRVVIERSINKLNIIIFVSRPGMVIGRSGQGIEDLRKVVESLVGQKASLNVEEIKRFDQGPYLVGRSIADRIE